MTNIKSAKLAIAKDFIKMIEKCIPGFIEKTEPGELLEITFRISGRSSPAID